MKANGRISNRWRSAAGTLARAIPPSRLEPAVVAWATAAKRSRTPWHVALSGGADSVALLLLAWAHWPERRGRLRALHFDHQIRGAASRADAAYCRRLCAALGVPLAVGCWTREDKTVRVSEGQARAARMGFFARHARVLWLGHHRDDVAESMLMRLARGSGAAGLSAPRPIQQLPGGRVHLRPLLTVTKREIMDLLRAAGVRWREDETNATGEFFRNRIRRDVIPGWMAAAQRDAVAGAARSRQLLEEDDTAIEAWVDDLACIGKSGDLLLRRLAGKPRAVLRRALHRWLLQCHPRVDVSRQAFDALLAAAESGRPTRHSLGADVFAVVTAHRMRFVAGKAAGNFQRRVN